MIKQPIQSLPRICGSLLIVAGVTYFYSGEAIKAPPAVPTDSGAIVVSLKKGGVRWSANWTMEPAEWQGRKAVRFTERGQGRLSPFSGEVRWTLDAVWSAENNFQPVDFEKTVTTPSGSRLLMERKRFDPNNHAVRFERQFAGRSGHIVVALVESLQAIVTALSVKIQNVSHVH